MKSAGSQAMAVVWTQLLRKSNSAADVETSGHAAERVVAADGCFFSAAAHRHRVPGRLGSPGRVLGLEPGGPRARGMAAGRHFRGRGPVPDAAGEGCDAMGASYYDTLLPVREAGAGLGS